MPDPSGTNPDTATREQYTAGMLANVTIPDNASPEYKKYGEPLQTLYYNLAHHEAMRPNMQQTFTTPANSKNRVYFMWDFIGRTLGGYLYNLPPEAEWSRLPEPFKELSEDVISRSIMAANLMLNTTPGMLNTMVETTYPGQAGAHPDFGEACLEQARILLDG